MTHSKKLRKEIKKLACIAHEREMNHYLECLNQKFSDWKSGKLDSWDLVQLIHEFHNGQARNLYNAFQNLSFEIFLARAIAGGYCDIDELPEEIREEFRSKAEIFRPQFL